MRMYAEGSKYPQREPRGYLIRLRVNFMESRLGGATIRCFRIDRPRITPRIHRFDRCPAIQAGNKDGDLPRTVVCILLPDLSSAPHNKLDVSDYQAIKNDFEVGRLRRDTAEIPCVGGPLGDQDYPTKFVKC